jgi:exodeoxyribonuclease VII small subunit
VSVPRFHFEQALAELEQLVQRLEQADLPLETALQEFERGTALARQCREALTQAEQKVQILTEQGGQAELQPFKGDTVGLGNAN